jgi:uncharacterized membrane protein YfcA
VRQDRPVEWERELVAAVAGFVIAMVTVPVGVSGAVFLLPVQLDLLRVPSPQVTPTNLLYNVVAVPGSLLGRGRPARTDGRLIRLLLLGTVPGVVAGGVLRVLALPGEHAFRWLAAAVLLVMGLVVLAAPVGSRPAPWLSDRVIAGAGLVAGTVGGIYGIGGGSLLGPFLVGAGLSVAAVAPAALLTTLLTSVVGAATYAVLALFEPGPIAPDWILGLVSGLGGVAGARVGLRLRSRLPEVVLRRLLGSLAVGLAVVYAARALG